MSTEIKIINKSAKVTEINIEGIIGEVSKGSGMVSTYRELEDVIRSIEEIGTKTIVVNIRSIGGNVNDALLIYDALAGLNCRIVTRCYGYVASAATIIAQAAEKGKREISKNALYLIHKSSSTTEGNSEELSKTINLLNKTDERIADIYAERSGRNAGYFRELMAENNGNGRWLSPKEVINEGLADRIIAAEEISNEVKDAVEILNLPEIPGKQTTKINMKKHWNAILEVLGIGTEKEVVINESHIKTLDSELAKRASRIDELEKRLEEYDKKYDGKAVNELQNRIVELEALNAKLRTKATQTLPKEDPSLGDFKRSTNMEAYEQDAVNFKHY